MKPCSRSLKVIKTENQTDDFVVKGGEILDAAKTRALTTSGFTRVQLLSLGHRMVFFHK